MGIRESSNPLPTPFLFQLFMAQDSLLCWYTSQSKRSLIQSILYKIKFIKFIVLKFIHIFVIQIVLNTDSDSFAT